jgi:hypothetical protein
MAQRLGELLSELPALKQVQVLSVLQKHFDATLPARFRGEAQVVALEQGELRVLCSNGAVASRLRLEAQNLAESLQQHGLSVRRVSLKVRPASIRKPATLRKKAALPESAKHAFESAAEQMDEGVVKAALQKLLKHHLSSKP